MFRHLVGRPVFSSSLAAFFFRVAPYLLMEINWIKKNNVIVERVVVVDNIAHQAPSTTESTTGS